MLTVEQFIENAGPFIEASVTYTIINMECEIY
jgi:hypothetical protein